MMDLGVRSGAITNCRAVSYLVQSTYRVLLLCFDQISYCMQSRRHGGMLTSQILAQAQQSVPRKSQGVNL